MCVSIYLSIYIYIERERERETHTHTHTHMQHLATEKSFLSGDIYIYVYMEMIFQLQDAVAKEVCIYIWSLTSLFFSYCHSLSSLCVHALTWSEV